MREAHAEAFAVLRRERPFLGWMIGGSIIGAAAGSLLLGLVPTDWLLTLLGALLLVSAIKTFQHSR